MGCADAFCLFAPCLQPGFLLSARPPITQCVGVVAQYHTGLVCINNLQSTKSHSHPRVFVQANWHRNENSRQSMVRAYSGAGVLRQAYDCTHLHRYTSARYTFVMEAKQEKDMQTDMNGMFSTNVGFTVLPVTNIQHLYANIKVCLVVECHGKARFFLIRTPFPPSSAQAAHVPGVTLLFDHPYPAFPNNFGTWLEVLLPLYGQLVLGTWRKHIADEPQYIDQVLFVNLKRDQIHVCWCLYGMSLRHAPSCHPKQTHTGASMGVVNAAARHGPRNCTRS